MQVDKQDSKHIQFHENARFQSTLFKNSCNTLKPTLSQRYTIVAISVLYCIGIVPFRFQISKHSTKNPSVLQVRKNTLQRTLCIILHIILVTRICLNAYHAFGKFGVINFRNDSGLMLQAAIAISEVFASGYFVATIWQFECRFQSLLKFNCQLPIEYTIPETNVFSSLQSVLAITFSIASSVALLVNVIYQSSENMKLDYWNLAHLTYIVASNALYLVSLNIPDTFFPIVALAFRDAGKKFCSVLLSSKVHGICSSSVLNEFIALEEYVNKLNDAFGTWILMYTVMAIPFYSLNLIKLLEGNILIVEGIAALAYCCSSAFFLLMAAGVSSKVSLKN